LFLGGDFNGLDMSFHVLRGLYDATNRFD